MFGGIANPLDESKKAAGDFSYSDNTYSSECYAFETDASKLNHMCLDGCVKFILKWYEGVPGWENCSQNRNPGTSTTPQL